jgi:ribosome modulation factor
MNAVVDPILEYKLEQLAAGDGKLRMHGRFGPIRTAEQSYKEGFEAGVTWDSKWTPGGPFHYSASVMDRDSDWIAHCEATCENHREWMRGWREGKSVKDMHQARNTGVDVSA